MKLTPASRRIVLSALKLRSWALYQSHQAAEAAVNAKPCAQTLMRLAEVASEWELTEGLRKELEFDGLLRKRKPVRTGGLAR